MVKKGCIAEKSGCIWKNESCHKKARLFFEGVTGVADVTSCANLRDQVSCKRKNVCKWQNGTCKKAGKFFFEDVTAETESSCGKKVKKACEKKDSQCTWKNEGCHKTRF